MGLFVSKSEDDRLITIIHSLENRIAILEGGKAPHPPPPKVLNRNIQSSIQNFKFKNKKRNETLPTIVNKNPTLFDELSSAISKRRYAITDEDELYISTADFIIDGLRLHR
jgi:hypothetical protein